MTSPHTTPTTTGRIPPRRDDSADYRYRASSGRLVRSDPDQLGSETAERQATIIINVPEDVPHLPPVAATALLRLLLAVAESDALHTARRGRAA